MSSHDLKLLDSTAPADWKITKATVTSCRQSFLSSISEGAIDGTGDSTSLATYIVTFEYEVDNARYSGRMTRGTPVNTGHHFEISYNPMHPARNTGSEFQLGWFRIVAWAIGAAIAGAVIYFENR